MMLIPILIAVGIITLFIWHLRNRNKYFEPLGIRFPEPSLVVGNLLAAKDRPLHEAIQEWTRKYGKVYGYFEGGTPIMVISDLDMLQEIFVRQFSKFYARKEFPIQTDPEKSKHMEMFSARGQRWKRLRAIINPTFSAAKMKEMVGAINDCIDVLMEVIHEKAEKPFDIYLSYQGLTMDVIGRCAFGLVSNCQRDPSDEFLTLCRSVMQETVTPNLLTYLAILFPELRSFWTNISLTSDFIRKPAFFALRKTVQPVIDSRKERPSEAKKCVDLLQLMLDAESDDTTLESDTTDPGSTVPTESASKSPQWKFQRKLMTEEVVQQCILFLIAGYETTSTALAYATYLLATNPEVQKKLHAEIDEHFPDQDDIRPTYDSVAKLQYLDDVLHESLRLYPIATPVQARTCMEDCTINGVFIPRGLGVCADVWTVHYDPDIWGPEPEKFRPERWAPELQEMRHPMAYMPFGAGPRSCIGMRFALLEEKVALTRLLHAYSFQVTPQTQIPLKLKEGASTTPEGQVIIRLERRRKDRK